MRKHRRLLIVLLGIVAATALAASLYLSLSQTFRPPPLPVPNGYDDLLRAARLVAADTADCLDGQSVSETCKQTAAVNEPALDVARKALRQECAVPIDWSPEPDFDAHFEQIHLVRRLGRAMMLDFRVHVAEHENELALTSAVELVELAQAIGRQGLIVDVQVGHAYLREGLRELSSLVPQLDAAATADLQRTLRRWTAAPESVDDLLRRDREYALQGWSGLESLVIRLQTTSLEKGTRQLIEYSQLEQQALLRLLNAQLAIRTYELQHGTLPTRLSELEQRVGTDVLIDPYSGRPLVYRPVDGRYDLYSVGRNGRDDGGTVGQNPAERDLRLERGTIPPAAEEPPN